MKKLIKFLLSPEVIRYVVMGVLATFVSMASYMAARFFGVNYQVSNVISWICAVTFAYVTNKFYVFQSRSTDLFIILKEMAGFYGARLATLALEMAVMWIMVELLWIHDLIAKCVGQILVMITNYLFSKFIVFKKK